MDVVSSWSCILSHKNTQTHPTHIHLCKLDRNTYPVHVVISKKIWKKAMMMICFHEQTGPASKSGGWYRWQGGSWEVRMEKRGEKRRKRTAWRSKRFQITSFFIAEPKSKHLFCIFGIYGVFYIFIRPHRQQTVNSEEVWLSTRDGLATYPLASVPPPCQIYSFYTRS